VPLVPRPVSGTVITSAWGALVADAVVMHFATPAERDSLYPSPPDGAMCVTISTGQTWLRRSGVWVADELAYAQVTGTVNVTATAYATADVLITAPAVTLDGGLVMVEYFAPSVTTAAAGQIGVALWDGTTDLGIIAQFQSGGTGSQRTPLLARRRLTPTAGSHTFSVRAVVAGGTAAFSSGPGGASQLSPAYLRLTRP
jgi:hypothetical protein